MSGIFRIDRKALYVLDASYFKNNQQNNYFNHFNYLTVIVKDDLKADKINTFF